MDRTDQDPKVNVWSLAVGSKTIRQYSQAFVVTGNRKSKRVDKGPKHDPKQISEMPYDKSKIPRVFA
jgi:hypothetical protein